MKRLSIIGLSLLFGLAVAVGHGVADTCSIQNRENTEIGVNKAITGQCSNNGMVISCSFTDSQEITCSGPGGDYSGNDLNALIISACDCNNQE